jgi:hypothetical protein
MDPRVKPEDDVEYVVAVVIARWLEPPDIV